jgi:hypothetical protein
VYIVVVVLFVWVISDRYVIHSVLLVFVFIVVVPVFIVGVVLLITVGVRYHRTTFVVVYLVIPVI